ncbi:MAG: hypothetical protein IJN38_06340, partial [Clostridia bacterium]|nr:hypothetical protein [Clostridia bacterium]
MSLKSECLLYFESAMTEYRKEYPDKEDIINSVSAIFSDFVSEDYEGITENRIYRLFLNTLKEILNTAFENNCSKSFLRGFFKILNNKKVTDYLSSLAKTKSIDIKYQLHRLYNEF